MKNFKGTPGPWRQSHRISDAEGNYRTQVYDDKGETICSLAWYAVREGNKTYSLREENAQAISAVPEMIEALQEIRKWYEANHEIYLGEETPVCFSKGLTALNKALGE